MELAPVFPLSNAVLFPDTVLPLHIFEPRYLQMVRDVSGGEGHMAIALLEPGFEEDYEGSPAFHRVGTLGRVENVEELPNGRFDLHLVGLRRVEFEEIPSPTAYRVARLIPRDETGVDDDDPEIVRAKLDLLASHAFLVQQVSGETAASLAANDRLSFRAAINGACANMPIEAQVRQSLLEIDDLRERQHSAQQLVNDVLENVLALKTPDLSVDDSQLN
jgi:Lon protease-like protein